MALVLRADRFTPSLKKDILYQDFLSSMQFSSDTSDLFLSTNEDSVKQSIINLLLTNPGEKLFNPTLGSEINKILFENITPQTTASLIKLIRNTIENFEPRAQLLDVIASPLEEENAYSITIVFSVINKTEPITLDLLLNRIR